MHTVDDIEPGESKNMSVCFAFEFTQASPHSACLKDEARWNMYSMSVTADTSHFDRSWLNLDAPVNINAMLVTADTSHLDRSWLNSDARWNKPCMSLMADTSQVRIDPCGFLEQSPISDVLKHSLIASRSSSLDSGLKTAAVS